MPPTRWSCAVALLAMTFLAGAVSASPAWSPSTSGGSGSGLTRAEQSALTIERASVRAGSRALLVRARMRGSVARSLGRGNLTTGAVGIVVHRRGGLRRFVVATHGRARRVHTHRGRVGRSAARSVRVAVVRAGRGVRFYVVGLHQRTIRRIVLRTYAATAARGATGSGADELLEAFSRDQGTRVDAARLSLPRVDACTELEAQLAQANRDLAKARDTVTTIDDDISRVQRRVDLTPAQKQRLITQLQAYRASAAQAVSSIAAVVNELEAEFAAACTA